MGLGFKIEETSLSGNQLYSQMAGEKTKWTGADDDFLDMTPFKKDRSDSVVRLEAQRIRMFRVTLQRGQRPHVFLSE